MQKSPWIREERAAMAPPVHQNRAPGRRTRTSRLKTSRAYGRRSSVQRKSDSDADHGDSVAAIDSSANQAALLGISPDEDACSLPEDTWASTGDAQIDAQALLSGQAGTRDDASANWGDKLANRLALVFDTMKHGVTLARRSLYEPSGKPPGNEVLDGVIKLALSAMGGPTTSLIRRVATRVLPAELILNRLVDGVKGVIHDALDSGIRAMVTMAQGNGSRREDPESSILDRFILKQELALNGAKGQAIDAFSDSIRPVLADMSPNELANLHRELAKLSASEELAMAQAAQTIVAWTKLIALWHHGSFVGDVDVWQYRKYGNGGWSQKLKQGSMQIKLAPMTMPEIWAGTFEGKKAEIKSLKIYGISSEAKAALTKSMTHVGDLRGILTFLSFNAEMTPGQPTIVHGIGPAQSQHRDFNITMVRRSDDKIELGSSNKGHTTDWLERYYRSMLGDGTAIDGARDIFEQVDSTPLPTIG